MPFKPPDVPKCPKCGKSVYAAEERVAGGQKWHKTCFKCGLCNKALDSTNCAEHEGDLFCKVCHGRKYGPKGYGFGGGAGALTMDKGEHLGNVEGQSNRPSGENKNIARAPDGEGCPRCGGYVYAAEQMLARGRGWHKGCFKCNSCKKQLDSTLHNDGPDKEIYCKQAGETIKSRSRGDSDQIAAIILEMIREKNQFKEIEDPVCYAKKFGPRGYGFGSGSGALTSDTADVTFQDAFMPKRGSTSDTATILAPEGEGCPRCGGMVYAAEQMLAAKGRAFHKKCFNCHDCHKPLDSVLACDSPDGDVYCRTCYGKKYGPKGYGFGGGAGFLQTDTVEDGTRNEKPMLIIDTTSIKAPVGEGCPRCGGMVYAAEQQLAKGTMWHKKCFNCADCHRPLDSMLACDGPDKEIYCKTCYGKKFGPKGFGFGYAPTLVSVGGIEGPPPQIELIPKGQTEKAPEGEGCGRCGYPVYAAEQMVCKGRLWHKRCFNCADCHRSLDSTNTNDAPNGEIYCKGCYNRKFGPKGVGYGMGAGALTTY